MISLGLLLYNLFSDTLQKIGFILNPYNICVANKSINGKQCTITWYVDNLKVPYVESSVVDSIINSIESYFGKMTVTRGSKHVCIE